MKEKTKNKEEAKSYFLRYTIHWCHPIDRFGGGGGGTREEEILIRGVKNLDEAEIKAKKMWPKVKKDNKYAGDSRSPRIIVKTGKYL